MESLLTSSAGYGCRDRPRTCRSIRPSLQVRPIGSHHNRPLPCDRLELFQIHRSLDSNEFYKIHLRLPIYLHISFLLNHQIRITIYLRYLCCKLVKIIGFSCCSNKSYQSFKTHVSSTTRKGPILFLGS